jgi:subtilisin-like proprotein convertase family protein
MLKGKFPRLFGIFVALALLAAPMVWLVSPASASGTFSNTASIGLVDPNTVPASQAKASTYPSDITVSGQTGNISSLTVTLSGINYSFSQDLAVLLVGPTGTGTSLSLFTSVGANNQSTATSNLDVTLSDSGTSIPYNDPTFPTSGSITMKPADFTSDLPSAFSYYDQFPSPAPTTIAKAAPSGTESLGTEFDGISPNGTWSLYVTTNSEGDGSGSIASGWSLNITTAATVAATTTTLASSQDPSFTTSPNASTTLTANVKSSGSPVTSGTVEFTDGGTTISGCGAAALDASGDATCNTSFTTEGDHDLEAIYSGTTSFVSSQAAFTQEVDNHTVVSGNNFANTGALDIPNATGTPGVAAVYPSHVFVSGLTGSVADVEVSLNDITYPFAQDLDVMLVGPQGGSEILLSGVGPNTGTPSATGLTLNIDDSAKTPLAESATLPTNTSVLTEPVDYAGVDTDTFPSPAPSAPYGTPAPRGSRTLGDEFNGTNPNGTWSLYVVTDGAGDGAGEILGGWSLTITTGSEALTSTTVTSSLNPSFTSGANQSVTFTATVTSGTPATAVTTGTVDFTSDGTTISGCGAAALNTSGKATCTTSFSTEADLTIEALYGGTASFAVSTGSLTQDADNVTTVVAPNQFANPGAITLNNPTSATPTPEEASPYPSRIYVSNLGPVTGLTVTLKGITYPHAQDLDILLVGPTGKSIVLLSNVGPSTGGSQNASNVNVTFSDTGSTIPSTVALGVAGSSVTAKPVDYSGTDDDTFPSPAPSGTYGTPAPKGSATLGNTFDSTDPNGAWSLYVVTVGEGDGTGSIAGDWSIDFAVSSQTISFSSTAPSTADAGTTYQASASATSTLPVTYSIDGGSTPGACSVDATGKVSFLTAGSCILDANQSGDGNWSAAPQVQQTINVVSAPGAPTALTATASDSEVVLNWTAPAGNGGAPITSYNIYQGTSSGGETLLHGTGTTGTTFTSTGLTDGTTYYFEVTAVNGVGESSLSNEVSATPAVVPGAPTALTAAGGNAQVALAWAAPANTGGDPVLGYKIYQGTSSGGEALLTSTSTTATTFTSTGLTNGTTYYYDVTAVTLAGEGPVSNEASATPGTLPGAPTGLSATFGNAQVALSWTAPTSDGGSTITSYNIYKGTSSNGETLLTSATGTSYTATGLTNGTKYFFEVTAVNGVGEGLKSNEASATPATLPGAPTGLSATFGNAQVALSWTAPSDTGGDPVISYNIYQGTSSGSETLLQSTGSTATTFTSTGLTNGTTYYFEVTAVTLAGEGPLSTEASATPVNVPGAPTGLTATGGNAEVVLNWTAPTNDGGAVITSYNVYKGTSSGGESFQASANATSYTATGLTNGTTYYFVVTAVNGAGESLVSNEASATPATLPGPPTGLSAVAGNGQVFLTWAAPGSSGGSAATSYNIYKGTSSGGETLLTNATGTSFTATGLTNGATYYFEVAAVNRVGVGPFSNEASAMPAVPPPPPPPTSTTTTTTTTTPLPPQGYLMVGEGGQVYSFGNSVSYGSVRGHENNIVGLASTADGGGYWIVGSDGRVFSFGDAHNFRPGHGTNGKVDQIVGIAPTPSGAGYWLAGSNGQVYAFGNAHDYGSVHSTRKKVDQVIGIAVTTDGRGYWLVGSHGTVYPFGDAHNLGSLSSRNIKAQDIVGITATADGAGYWLVGSAGRVYAFGDAQNFGSVTSSGKGTGKIVAMTRTPDGRGYWVVASNGTAYNFGDARPEGSLSDRGVSTHSIVGVAP